MELEAIRKDYRSPIPRNLRWSAWAANAEGITGEELLRFVNDTLFPKLKTFPSPVIIAAALSAMCLATLTTIMKSGQLMRQVINKIQTIDFNKLAERRHFGEIYERILNDLQSAGNAGEYYTPRAITAL